MASSKDIKRYQKISKDIKEKHQTNPNFIAFQGILGGSFGVALETLKVYFNLGSNEFSTGLSLQAIGGCISAFLGESAKVHIVNFTIW